MGFVAIEKEQALFDGYCQPHLVGNLKLLLIQTEGKRFLVENRCGHFGIPLEQGEITQGTITCPQHYIRFDLTSGQVVSQTRDNCDPIRVFTLISQDGDVGINL